MNLNDLLRQEDDVSAYFNHYRREMGGKVSAVRIIQQRHRGDSTDLAWKILSDDMKTVEEMLWDSEYADEIEKVRSSYSEEVTRLNEIAKKYNSNKEKILEEARHNNFELIEKLHEETEKVFEKVNKL